MSEAEGTTILERDASGTTTIYDGEGGSATITVPPTMSAVFALGGGVRYPQGLYEGDTLDYENGVVRGLDGSERVIHVDIGSYGNPFFVNPKKLQHPRHLARSLRKLLVEQDRVLTAWQKVFQDIKSAGRVHYQNEYGTWAVLQVTNHGYGDGLGEDPIKRKPRKVLHPEIGERYKKIDRRMMWINTIVRHVTLKLKGLLLYNWLPDPDENHHGPKYLRLTVEGTRWMFYQGGYGPWTLLVEPTHKVIEMEL